jgi:hypothetical protein
MNTNDFYGLWNPTNKEWQIFNSEDRLVMSTVSDEAFIEAFYDLQLSIGTPNPRVDYLNSTQGNVVSLSAYRAARSNRVSSEMVELAAQIDRELEQLMNMSLDEIENISNVGDILRQSEEDLDGR